MSYIIRPGRKRKQTINNLLADIIIHEKVVINLSYVKNLIKIFSKLVNWAKRGDLHSRRLSMRYLHSFKEVSFLKNGSKIKVIDKLFNNFADRYRERNGGYVRANSFGRRKGDGSKVALVSLV